MSDTDLFVSYAYNGLCIMLRTGFWVDGVDASGYMNISDICHTWL